MSLGLRNARRRLVFALLVLLTVTTGCGERKPLTSVVLISLDTLRFDHLGFHGYPRDTSPNLDALALQSVVFDRAISQASSTTASHRALFASTYASAWRPSFAALPVLLRDAGYRTGAFTGGANLSKQLGFAAGFDVWEEEEGGLSKSLPRVERWLRNVGEESFFLFVHTYDIHLPYDPPPPHDSLYVDYAGALRGEQTRDLLRRVRRLGKYADVEEDVDVPAEVRERIVALYDGGIHYTDARVGELLELLETLGLADDVIVIVFSDHGEEFWDHGSVIHSHTVFEELVHVPLLWRLPGGRAQGRRVSASVGLMDVAPTILELVGLETPETFSGTSLVPLIDGAAAKPRPTLSESGGLRGFTRYPWKLATGSSADPPLLFDLAADPREQHDVYADHPAIAARLLAEVSRVASQSAAERVRELDPAAMTPELRDRLRALGYID